MPSVFLILLFLLCTGTCLAVLAFSGHSLPANIRMPMGGRESGRLRAASSHEVCGRCDVWLLSTLRSAGAGTVRRARDEVVVHAHGLRGVLAPLRVNLHVRRAAQSARVLLALAPIQTFPWSLRASHKHASLQFFQEFMRSFRAAAACTLCAMTRAARQQRHHGNTVAQHALLTLAVEACAQWLLAPLPAACRAHRW
jgi:hypothetical protein